MKNTKASCFKNYAKFYTLLYSDKDYRSEADYIIRLIKQDKSSAHSILELGCGTGNHARALNQSGYYLHCIDFSQNMVDIAKRYTTDSLSFEQGDVRTYRCDKKFDIIISLFHVASYQTSNEDILQFIETAKHHLKKDGLFIFDFWYGPAVLSIKPEVRQKIVENDKFKIIRFSRPELFVNKNVCDVHFNFLIIDKATDQISELYEKHRMRYFFIPEIEYFLSQSSIEIIDVYKWMTNEPLNIDTWNAVVVSKIS